MNWGSAAEFWHMGGYGLYVWGSYLVMALLVIFEVVMVVTRGKGVRRRLGRARALARRGVKDET